MKLLSKRILTECPLVAMEYADALLQDYDPQLAESPYARMVREKLKPQPRIEDDVAIIPIEGLLARRPDAFELLFGVEDTENVLQMLADTGGDPKVKALVLDINSPGGFYKGIPEAAELIQNIRQRKPVVAWTGVTMASAAYWIGSQATEVIASKSASVGSIGLFAAYLDASMALAQQGLRLDVFTNREGDLKTTGLMGMALTDEQRQYIRQSMQDVFEEFKADLLRSRPNIPADAMRGQSFNGRKAQEKGLVDRIGNLGFAISVARSLIRNKG